MVDYCENISPEIEDFFDSGAIYGLYKDEAGLTWTGEYSEVNLRDDKIDANGLEIQFSVLEENVSENSRVYIYINGVKVYEEYLQGITQESLVFAPNQLNGIKSLDNIYCIEIYCTYPEKDEEISQRTGIQVKYIGGKR